MMSFFVHALAVVHICLLKVKKIIDPFIIYHYNSSMKEQENDTLCPCGSGKNYSNCCAPIISGGQKALTAEDLMRARYSAYAMHEIAFIASSCLKENDEDSIDMDETRRWSEESEWLGLRIVRTEKGGVNDTEGLVEFTATFKKKGLKDVHKEQATFVKKDGNWLYSAGSITPVTVVREGKKVGRNELCPCNSGKKYKQCCGR